MSNRTMLEFNHDYCPTDNVKAEYIEGIISYMRSGDPKWLPDGVTYFGMRHHSDPCPMGDPPRGWRNDRKSA